jgi:glycerol-3-phosphate O-acyltransferase
VPRAVAQARAHHYANEIVPSFSAYAYFGIGTRLARRVSTYLYRVRLGYMDEDAMKTVDPDAAVIFVINHRSNMDYVLVTFMVATSSALSYAVGEWARVWLLQSLIRSMGAYFVRRDSREPLYRKVLSRYVHLAIAGGLAQAMFPEGGLTRDGRLRPPKLGLLSYMVSGFDPKGPRDAVFVPVGINYDRVIEDRVQVAALMTPEGEKPRFKFSPKVLFGYLMHNVALRFRGKLYRYGYACVGFGKPVSLRQYVAERGIDFRMLDETRRFAEIERLGETLMQKVGQVVPALPVSLVATVMLAAGKPLSVLELKGEVETLIRRLIAGGAHIHIPRADQDYALEVGLRMLLLRHLVEEENGLYRANPREDVLLRYYANSIVHLLPAGKPDVAAAAE